jgi:hypothetical protein
MYAKYFHDNTTVRYTVTVTIVADYLDGRDEIGLDPTTNLSTDEHDEDGLLHCNAMHLGEGLTFQRNITPSSVPFIPLVSYLACTSTLKMACRLLLLVSYFAYSSALKRGAKCSSETLRFF